MIARSSHARSGTALGIACALACALVSCSDAAEAPLSGSDASASGGSSGARPADTVLDAAAEAAAPLDDPAERQPETGFITRVESFTPGECAGFNADKMPGVVFGAPRGGGAQSGGLDVISLGTGGSIVLAFDPIRIVDQPGPDFIVFENAFFAGGNPGRPFQEFAEVSVSADGVSWRTFPCASDAALSQCAGQTPVYSAPGNGVSATDPEVSGGDAFDLAEIDVGVVRYVRIRDLGSESCAGTGGPGSAGFDLDAIAVLHAALP